MTDIHEIIRNRRAVFPGFYSEKEIERKQIEQILENANWAPTHKHTEPWRFKVFRGKACEDLGHFMADWYKQNTDVDKFSDLKYNKTIKKARKSSCIIAICMRRDPQERVPEWEELAAVACAVQNMWLSCTALDIGCYWSTHKSMSNFGDFIAMSEDEICLGYLFMGYNGDVIPEGHRESIKDKVQWYE